MTALTEEMIKPWYKQFWPWFLIFIPAATIVAGVSTVIIATINRDSLVVDNYYKEGLGINRVIQSQQHAAKLDLQAKAIYNPGSGETAVIVTGNENVTGDISLLLIHPTIKKFDRELLLKNTGNNRFVGNLKDIEPGRWNLILKSDDNRWRLDANIMFPTSSWIFKPDV